MRLLLVIVALVLGATAATAQDQGRFSMAPTEDGFLRLDRQTGAISLCQRSEGEWACESVTDNAAALREQVARLTRENERLRDELARLRGNAPGAQSGDGGVPESEGRRELELPSEKDIDKAMDLLERLLQRFKNLGKDLRDEPKGTPL